MGYMNDIGGIFAQNLMHRPITDEQAVDLGFHSSRGLVCGLHEGAKTIEKHAAQLWSRCTDHNVNLITVPSAKTLGEWTGA